MAVEFLCFGFLSESRSHTASCGVLKLQLNNIKNNFGSYKLKLNQNTISNNIEHQKELTLMLLMRGKPLTIDINPNMHVNH